MKTYVIVAAAFATLESAMGMRQFLQELPNGSLFQQALGHPGDDSSQETDFAQAFDNAGQSWTKSLCEAKFPGSSMTNGAAFGDPCCTWKKGGKPDFTVAPFTTTPGKATTCASNGATGSASDSTKGGSPASSQSGASDATKGGSPASDATKGESSDPTQGGASDATKGEAPASGGWTPAPNVGQTNDGGSTPSPSMRCAGKPASKKHHHHHHQDQQ